jgi:hypothetical protein
MVPWSTQSNACLYVENANGGNRDVRVLDNLFDGAGYAFTVNGSTPELHIHRNRWTGNHRWGPADLYNGAVASTSSDNKLLNGTPVSALPNRP